MICSQIGRYPAVLALACLVTLGSWQPVRAFGADEYVLPTDCVAEQEAYRAAPQQDSVTKVLERPWIYKFNSFGAKEGPDDFRRIAARLDDEIAIEERKPYSNLADARLSACAYRAAAARMEASFRQVTAGLPVRSLVSQGDCQAELGAYIAAHTNDIYHKIRASQIGRSLDVEARGVAADLIGQVHYNYYMGLRGQRLNRQDFLSHAAGAKSSAAISAEFKKEDEAALGRLAACLYGLAADRVGEEAGDLPSPQSTARAEPEVVTCAADRLREMNVQIADQDSRLDAFLKTSDYVKASGPKNATPMLTVTLWALKGQIDAIRTYCPDVEAHKRRIEDLEASLKATQEACDQIQAGGATCKPTAPEAI